MTRIRSVIGTSLALLLAVAGLCLAPSIVTAAQSATFRLQETGPGNAAGITHGSPSFQMQGDVSWRQETPLHSLTFQITNGPPTSTSSSAASSAGQSSSSVQGGGNGTSPTRPPTSRPSVPPRSTSSSSSSVSSASSSSSLASAVSSASSEDLRGAAPVPTGSGSYGQGYRCDAILCADRFWHPIVLVPVPEGDTSVGLCSQPSISLLLLLLAFLLGVLVASFFWSQRSRQRHDLPPRAFWIALLVVAVVIIAVVVSIQTAQAAVTSPQRHVYNGHLLNASGQAITTPHSIRFSEWYSRDMQASDVNGAGAIDTGAATYAGYQEVFTVTPDAQGYFSVVLGTGAALPNLAIMNTSDLDNLFLQVEVKAAASADTAYEVLDTNPDDALIDRSPVLSVPFAQNADLLDQREIGTGSGSIPVLQSGGLLPVSAVPGGTNRDTFVVDANDTAASNVTLQFGTTLAETLRFDIANSRFVFSDDLRVEGDLTVTGLINGIDISSIAASAGKLQVSSGAGLTISITAGGYRINGDVTDYPGASGIAVAANSTNYVFIGSGGLTVRTMPFPTDESFIRLAEVVTNGISVTQVNDRRIVQSDDREQNTEVNLHAEFQNASYQADAVDNVGQLSVALDNITQRNFYLWSSTRSTLQDYDVVVRVSLPADFARWNAAPLSVAYRTTSAAATDSRVDISVFDTNGVPVTLGGSATGLASTSWATTALTYSGTPTWTAGQEFLLKVKLSAKDNYQAHLGSIKLLYVRLTP